MRFETVVAQYHDEIHRYLWRMLAGSSADQAITAEDLTQETFARAWKGYPRLRANSNHRAWLYKIATNCALTTLKRGHCQASQRLPLDEEQHPDSTPSPLQHAIQAETLAGICQAIEQLPPRQQAALVMRHLQGLGYAEIADALGCSSDSARANVYQALRRLRSTLTPADITTGAT